MKSIIVQPCGGLCNRMRCIVGAAKLAEMMNKELMVIWTRDPSLNANVSDLFAPLPYRVVECDLSSVKYKLLFHWYKDLRRFKVIRDAEARKMRLDGLHDDLHTLLKTYVLSCESVVDCHDISAFSVAPEILRECSLNLGDNTYGIHIRRTDNIPAITKSPTKLFLSKVDEILEREPNATFFLATDDKGEEDLFRSRYGEKILLHPKNSYDRNDFRAIKDAVIDLYYLSRCKKIYGSYCSSFSDVASWWGNIEKEICVIEE